MRDGTVVTLLVIVGLGVGEFVTIFSGLLFLTLVAAVVVGYAVGAVEANAGTVEPTVSAAASARANTFFFILYIPPYE